ncbi:tail completion protein gp17 [Alcaligenes endophyticus]|uniref:DUF3168 domain-containing protein n=1 Tax=Alcaligenes endophyticus TaxID=1929088 RepID=A0ABT8EKA0_9BURK|nr:DUF3168 domain-containing protein [Alcaligenes endophyticus]MCX5592026.1 DUF3168 domain-containing protein [Alcaligenes endophyticus]MDN4121716.1 DUF3168 domain-containing protein [Alcaligenes endophyticus]
MTIEVAITALLAPLVEGRCYPDVTPSGAIFPLIVHQVVGGRAHKHLERQLPESENYRVQVYCWAGTRLAAVELGREIRRQVIEYRVGLKSAIAIGQRVSLYDAALMLYGVRQDFDIWIKEH